ncbi:MAG TPA: hypothetical protein VGK89_06285 [Candidatus Eisenbacteria bacterium]
MSARRLAALVIVGSVLAVAAASLAARGARESTARAAAEPAGGGGEISPDLVPKKIAYATELPDSAGRDSVARDIAKRWCLLCHSAMLITQQAKDSAAWEKTLGQMAKWGVAATPGERDTLRAYLVRYFGPR